MKYFRIAALITAMAAVSAIGFAQSTTDPAKAKPTPKAQSTTEPAKPKHAAKVITASMTGVVKSIGDNSFVINRSNAKGPEETFQLDPSHKGKLAVGDTVSVKYYLDNANKIATSVTVKKSKATGK
jgi:hypothetical protein